LKAPKVRQRKTPYHIGSPREITSVQRLHYPKNVSLKLDENPVNIENPALRYTYQDLFDNKVYTHRSSLLIKQKDVALKDMSDYLNSLEEIRKDWEYTLTVSDPESKDGYDELLTLKTRLKALSSGIND
jgi:hypothetical protein